MDRDGQESCETGGTNTLSGDVISRLNLNHHRCALGGDAAVIAVGVNTMCMVRNSQFSNQWVRAGSDACAGLSEETHTRNSTVRDAPSLRDSSAPRTNRCAPRWRSPSTSSQRCNRADARCGITHFLSGLEPVKKLANAAHQRLGRLALLLAPLNVVVMRDEREVDALVGLLKLCGVFDE